MNLFSGRREGLALDIHLFVLGIPCLCPESRTAAYGTYQISHTTRTVVMGTFFGRKTLLAIAECCINKDVFW